MCDRGGAHNPPGCVSSGNSNSPCSCLRNIGVERCATGPSANLCKAVQAPSAAACCSPPSQLCQACMHMPQRLPADPYCASDKREHSQWFYFRVSNCAEETLNVSLLGWAAPTLVASAPMCSNATACLHRSADDARGMSQARHADASMLAALPPCLPLCPALRAGAHPQRRPVLLPVRMEGLLGLRLVRQVSAADTTGQRSCISLDDRYRQMLICGSVPTQCDTSSHLCM